LAFIQTLQRLTDRQNLTNENISLSINHLIDGKLTDTQIAGFLIGLRTKGETVEEITEIARILRDRAVRIAPKVDLLLDTCGTGGDNSNTFNISTAVAFVVAGAGIPVAKHGNRSVSSQSGSADVLEALGVNLALESESIERLIERSKIGFLFAPLFHPAMKHAVIARRDLGIRTIFNCLGPLLNPAGATHQIVGIYDPTLTETIGGVLTNLGIERGMVVHGNGLDEITTTGPTKITQFHNGSITTDHIEPEDFGLKRVAPVELQCSSTAESAQILRSVLAGVAGPHRDIVLLNAGAAIHIAGKANSIRHGIEVAMESIDSGCAQNKLEELIAATRGDNGLLG